MRTFVVRIRADGDEGEPLRGVVDDVATGTRATFHAGEELVAVLVSQLRSPGEDEPPPSPSWRPLPPATEKPG